MTLSEKLQKIWDNKEQIAEGWYNRYISHNPEIKEEAQKRIEICKKCEYNDETGQAEIIVLKGQAGCMLCGCNRSALCHAMSKQCSADLIGLKPRWTAILTEDQEKEINQKEYEEQFKNR